MTVLLIYIVDSKLSPDLYLCYLTTYLFSNKMLVDIRICMILNIDGISIKITFNDHKETGTLMISIINYNDKNVKVSTVKYRKKPVKVKFAKVSTVKKIKKR